MTKDEAVVGAKFVVAATSNTPQCGIYNISGWSCIAGDTFSIDRAATTSGGVEGVNGKCIACVHIGAGHMGTPYWTPFPWAELVKEGGQVGLGGTGYYTCCGGWGQHRRYGCPKALKAA